MRSKKKVDFVEKSESNNDKSFDSSSELKKNQMLIKT